MICKIVVKSLGIKPERVREFINQINEQQIDIDLIRKEISKQSYRRGVEG